MKLNDKQWQVQTARGNRTFEKNNKVQFNVVWPLYPTSSVWESWKGQKNKWNI